MLASHSPDAGTITYTYTDAGQLASKTDAMGVTISYQYDAAGRRTDIIYADSSQNIHFAYDEGQFGKGRLTTISGPDATIELIYGPTGAIEQRRKTMAGVEYLTTYAYNNADQPTETVYPWGFSVNVAYDQSGQLSELTLTDANQQSTPLLSNAGYKPFGPLKSYTLGNGVQVSRSYDLAYQLTAIHESNILALDYSRDVVGRITAIGNNLDVSRDQGFGYDANDRLTEADGIYGAISYTYDKVGNRLTRSLGEQTETYSYLEDSNRLKAITSSAEQKIFIHDQAGRAVSIPSKEQGQVPETTYSYDYRELRIQKDQPQSQIIYHYDHSGNLLAETTPEGSLLRAYIYAIGMRIATVVPDGNELEIYYHHNDHLGTPQKLSDANGTVVWSADYLPFGKAMVDQSSVIVNNIRLPGQYYDSETGLHYNWHRFYDPETGRYISADPIGLAGGINLYAYANQNPVNFTDPEGLFAWGIPAYEAIKWGGAALIAAMGAKAAKETADAINEASSDNEQCETNRCKPCIPPVGTIATDVYQVPPGKPHFPIEGSHVHWFEMNQSPYPECRCFWKRNSKKPTPGDTTPTGTVPVTPAAGGGPM